MTIGKLAEEAGVGIETIRFYERRGLLPKPPRTASGYRQYRASEAERIRFIKRGQELGFSLAEIRELLSLRVDANADCGEVRRRTEAKIGDVERKLRDLERMKAALEALTRACAAQGPTSECPILDAMASDGAGQGETGAGRETTDHRASTGVNKGEGIMTRKIEIFTSGCPSCEETIEMVQRIACPSCDVTVHELTDGAAVRRAVELGIRTTPAVVIDGELAACCVAGTPDESTLRVAGLGQPIS